MIIPRTQLKTSSGTYYYNIRRNQEDYRKVVLPLIEKAFNATHDGYISYYYQQKVANVLCHQYQYEYYSMEEHLTFFFIRDEHHALQCELIADPAKCYNLLKGAPLAWQDAADQ